MLRLKDSIELNIKESGVQGLMMEINSGKMENNSLQIIIINSNYFNFTLNV